jgi:hypothetical protein
MPVVTHCQKPPCVGGTTSDVVCRGLGQSPQILLLSWRLAASIDFYHSRRSTKRGKGGSCASISKSQRKRRSDRDPVIRQGVAPACPPHKQAALGEGGGYGSDCNESRQNNEKWVAVPRTTLLRADTTLHPAPCSHYNRLTCILFAVRKASDIITVLAQEGGGRVPKFEGLVAWDPAGLGAEEPSTACLCEISRAFRCRNQYRRSNRSRRIRVLLAASGASWPRNSNASARGPRCN